MAIAQTGGTITAQTLSIETTPRRNGVIGSASSGDGYRISSGTATYAGDSSIDTTGRGVVIQGTGITLSMGMGTTGVAPESGVAKVGIGGLTSIESDQTAIHLDNSATKSHTLIDAGASVTGAVAAYKDGTGDAHLEINAGADISGLIQMGDGSDELTLNGQVDLSGIPSIDGGDDMSAADGMIDNLTFRGGYSGIDNGKFLNWENVNFHDGTYTVAGGTLSAGYDEGTGVFVYSGGVLDAGSSFTVDANLTTVGTGSFQIRGGGSGTYFVEGSVTNGGLIDSNDGATGDILTVRGDFVGNGGTYHLDTVLQDDSSPTDMLVVEGGTSGSSYVRVANAGGTGAVTTEGIKIIDVTGDSDGTFILAGDYVHEGEGAVVGGAYAYKLHKGAPSSPNDGNWYLRSNLTAIDEPEDPDGPGDPDDPGEPGGPVDPSNPSIPEGPLYQAGDPVYEAYPQLLLGLSSLPTLQQRVGNRYWAGNGNRLMVQGADAPDLTYAPAQEAGSFVELSGAWVRLEGTHHHIEPRVSTSRADYDHNTYRLQAGYDAALLDNGAGTLIGGLSVHYARGAASVSSPYNADGGSGKIRTDGFGVGGTLTWYGDGGFYVDGQAQVTWYRSDLSIDGGRLRVASDNDGHGYAFSIEAGQRIAIDPTWSVTPQAQLSFAKVKFDDFIDVFGADVSFGRGESLQGRIGIALDHENSWQNDKGTLDRAHVYGIANLYYEFKDGTQVDVSGVSFENKQDRLWGGIGVGGSYNWDNDRYSVYGEGLVTTSLNNFGDSYSVKATVGLRMKW